MMSYPQISLLPLIFNGHRLFAIYYKMILSYSNFIAESSSFVVDSVMLIDVTFIPFNSFQPISTSIAAIIEFRIT